MEQQLYSVTGLAEILGKSKSTVYRLMKQGKLGYHKVPGGRIISMEQIDKYLMSNEVVAEVDCPDGVSPDGCTGYCKQCWVVHGKQE